VITADANLLAPGASYWLGAANYGTGRWDWFGPFSDSHARVLLTDGDYTSDLGNVFLTVLVTGDDAVQLVGVGTHPLSAADSDAPPQVTGLSATPVPGGLALSWDAVAADDLAGYRIGWRGESFLDFASTGVKQLGNLEGTTSIVLSGLSGETFVRVAAVDVNGNVSPISAEASGTPEAGAAASVELGTAAPSGLLKDAILLTASGGDSYDWDLDGDGVFDDLTDDATGQAALDTSRAGVLRPRVRATMAGGGISYSAVSVLVSANTRPVANAVVSPQSGTTPVNVTYTGEAWDAEDDPADLTYAWDTNGDGTYNAGAEWNSLTPPGGTYVTPGIYNVKFRVTDSAGAWDVDTATVQVRETAAPIAELTCNDYMPYLGYNNYVAVAFDASGSTIPAGLDATYEFDPQGTGDWFNTGDIATYMPPYFEPGRYNARVRVTAGGKQDIATLSVEVYRFEGQQITELNSITQLSLYEFYGLPGIIAAQYDEDSGDYLTWLRRCTTANGEGWDDHYTNITSGTTAGYATSAISDGEYIYAVGYAPETDALRYMRKFMGGSNNGEILSGENAGKGVQALLLESGYVGIVFYDEDDQGIYFCYAQNAAMSSWTAPQKIADSGSLFIKFRMVNGRPTVVYYSNANDSLYYVQSSDGNGVAWGSEFDLFAGGVETGYHFDLAVVDGFPAIAYNDFDAAEIRFIRSSTADGNDVADWDNPVTVALPSASIASLYYPVILELDGRCYIVYADSASYVMVMAYSEVGDYSSFTSGVELDRQWGGFRTAIMEYDGHPAIVHINIAGIIYLYPRL
jgi:hypothetical protein